MSHSGVPGASLLSNNPKYNPLGGFGTTVMPIAEDIAAAALVPATGGLSLAAIPAIQGGYALSQGRTLPGLIDLAEAGLGGAGAAGYGPLAGVAQNGLSGILPSAASGAGGATAGATPAAIASGTAGGATGVTPDLASAASDTAANTSGGFLSNVGSDIQTGVSDVGSEIKSGWNWLTGGPPVANPTAAFTTPATGGQLSTADQALLSTGSAAGAGAPSITAGSSGLTAAQLGSLYNPAITTPQQVATALGGSAATASAAPAAAAAPSSVAQFIHNPSLSSFGNIIASNPSTALAAAGLGYQALTAPSLPSEAGLTNQMLGAANTATGQAGSLESALTTGQLPPGAQDAINLASNAAKQRIISNYAARGMDTNPATNSSLATELSNVDQQAAGAVFQAADQLYSQGLSQAQISNQLYNQILATTGQQQQLTASGLQNLTSALAGGGKGALTINLPAGTTT